MSSTALQHQQLSVLEYEHPLKENSLPRAERQLDEFRERRHCHDLDFIRTLEKKVCEQLQNVRESENGKTLLDKFPLEQMNLTLNTSLSSATFTFQNPEGEVPTVIVWTQKEKDGEHWTDENWRITAIITNPPTKLLHEIDVKV